MTLFDGSDYSGKARARGEVAITKNYPTRVGIVTGFYFSRVLIDVEFILNKSTNVLWERNVLRLKAIIIQERNRLRWVQKNFPLRLL